MSNLSIEHKKGEVNELKASLRNPAVERDPEKKREVVKRVIAYMTLGIDVSRLFTEMIMATSSKDLVIKKMVYLYVVNYASTNPELSILAINTFQKDCRDEDPMVRGLALRSFCSLRLNNIIEYLQKPIEDGLADPSAYVRKTATLACVKLHNLAPTLVADAGLVSKLRTALYDRDTSVIANAVCALEEIEGRRSKVEKQLVHHLLNRMREFNEWAQVVVLGLVARYAPAEPDETFAIMNLLEERLKHSNAAVVLATTKVFLNLTQDFPRVHQQVYARLRTPLVTLVHGGTVEQGYATLKHIALLAQRAPAVFAEEHKHFFCRFNEPTYVKLVKLDILTAVATPRNVSEIVEEVAEYVTDVDMAVSRRAVDVIGSIGARVTSAAKVVSDQLVAFLSIGLPHVSSEAVVAMRSLLRRHPELLQPAPGGGASSLAHSVGTFVRYTDEPEARVALLWIVGEFGEHIPEAPYILEPLIDEFGEEPASAVRLELLTAAVKLFVKRPPEMQAMLGSLLDAATTDARFTEVHDRAIFYYRLLEHDVQAAKVMFGDRPPVPKTFVEDMASEWQDRLFEEFNTLTVIYGLPSERFIKPGLSANAAARKELAQEAADEVARANASASAQAAREAHAINDEGSSNEEESSDDEDDSEEDDEDDSEEDEEANAAPPVRNGAAGSGSAGRAGAADSLMDLLGDISMPVEQPMQATPPKPNAPPPLTLTPAVTLDSNTFQAQWGALTETTTWTVPCSGNPTPQALVSALAAHNIKCMAFGTVGGQHKCYFYGQQPDGPVFLSELIVELASQSAKATVKCSAPDMRARFADMLSERVRVALAA